MVNFEPKHESAVEFFGIIDTEKKKRKLTDEDLGKLIGVNGDTISRYRKNPCMMNMGQLIKICDTFLIDVGEVAATLKI